MKARAKYTPKKQAKLAYMVLICFGVFLAGGKGYGVFLGNFYIFTDEITSHISNFSISLLFYLLIGYSLLKGGVKFHNIAILGLTILAANFICETLMAFMNTTDILDALYGSVGTILGFVFLLIVDKYGLQKDDTVIE